MAEQTFRSPGFFEQEIDLTQRVQEPVGTPAGVIGTAVKGPAFVPVTVGSFPDFVTKFGNLDPKKFGPYAVDQFLRNRTALTYLRVLGAGANDTNADIETTRTEGTVKNAGFKIASTVNPYLKHDGAVQFIVARHFVSSSEAVGFPLFTDNDSYSLGSTNYVNLVRGVVLMPSGTRLMALDPTEAFSETADDVADINDDGKFKLVISSSSPGFATSDGQAGVKILTASLNPEAGDYFGKILNTDPEQFSTEEHLLYADFAIENELTPVADYIGGSVGILSGSANTSSDSGDATELFREAFGRFDTRFSSARTTNFISQPYGEVEYDLFRFESIDDGVYGNSAYKISITDIRKSADPRNPYGTFNVVVRTFDDTDTDQKILERFPNCTLDPASEDYIGRKVGDRKVYFNFDAIEEEERRIVVEGRHPNRSKFVRVVIEQSVDDKSVPPDALPFGFRGLEILKTSDSLSDLGSGALSGLGTEAARRLAGDTPTDALTTLTGSIVPPLPHRFKVTRGAVDTVASWTGKPGLHWGVKFERLPKTSSIGNAIYNSNAGAGLNPLVASYAKFLGIKKLDTLVTGSGADAFNNNKFSLSKVALYNTSVNDLTASTETHVKQAAYIRNGVPSVTDYTIDDGTISGRITLGTLLAQTSSAIFNRFSNYAKFTNMLAGGFDGNNITDRDSARMNDKATAVDTGGAADSSYTSPGLLTNVNGTGKDNNAVASYRTAARIMSDPLAVQSNILSVPGIRDPFVTDYIADQTKQYSLSLYTMDLPRYDQDSVRIYDDSDVRIDTRKTREKFEERQLDNNYVAAYFPDVFVDDAANTRRVKVPASVAALAALGFNDRSAYPWFAPAGLNRAALGFVANTETRINAGERDDLYDARINPIVRFPNTGYVIWGQKTLQQAKSALDRVNVRRLMIEVKRTISQIAGRFVFEQNTAEVRQSLKKLIDPRLAQIQLQSGIELFKTVVDETNNTQFDVESNRLNVRIIVVPTRAAEFISIDFVITNSGVSFE
jgi:hypothetical protein